MAKVEINHGRSVESKSNNFCIKIGYDNSVIISRDGTHLYSLFGSCLMLHDPELLTELQDLIEKTLKAL